jgi:hypothetical protein
MDQHQTAITAAFVMEGLHDAGYDRVVKAYSGHGGAIELVDAVMAWVPAIERLRAAAEAVHDEYPGVFEYEVSSAFGHWIGESIVDDGDLPDRAHAMGILIDLVESFFRVRDDKDLSRRMRASLDAAADAIMAPPAANAGA